MYHLQNIFRISLKRQPSRKLTSGPECIVRKLSTAVRVPKGIRDGIRSNQINPNYSTRTSNKLCQSGGGIFIKLTAGKKIRKSAQTTVLLCYYPQMKTQLIRPGELPERRGQHD